uniref:ABC transporter permease n=1 Tax=Jatrophihabitans lederbergiae TaxID=3075547 RepID=UPI0037BF5737
MSTLDSAQPTAGSNYLLNVIAVVVIGGASLSGGVASMGRTFIGLLIIGVLNNGLSLLHVNPNLQQVVIGAVILAAVLTDRASIKLRS